MLESPFLDRLARGTHAARVYRELQPSAPFPCVASPRAVRLPHEGTQLAGAGQGVARVSVARSETTPREGNSYDKGIARGEPVSEGIARVIYFAQAPAPRYGASLVRLTTSIALVVKLVVAFWVFSCCIFFRIQIYK